MVCYNNEIGTERELTALCPFIAFMHQEQLKDPSILDLFREESFRVSFHKWRSHLHTPKDRMGGILYNFTIELETDNPDFIIAPYDLMFNGSWEGLEQHINDDIRYLRTLGVEIEYSGYRED